MKTVNVKTVKGDQQQEIAALNEGELKEKIAAAFNYDLKSVKIIKPTPKVRLLLYLEQTLREI